MGRRLLQGFKDSKVFNVSAIVWKGMEENIDGLAGYNVDKIIVDETTKVTPWRILDRVKGDMALIGPRPLLVKYLPRYSKEQMRRHEVRPGISGWAQCHGRNAISWSEKFKLDVWYVDHVSLITDLKVIGITIMKVLRRVDINEAGQATMEEFNGNN
jgi:hypothetical protein